MKRDTPQQRRSSALSEIYYYEAEVRSHDRAATAARKELYRNRAKLARAEKAIERQAAKLIFDRSTS